MSVERVYLHVGAPKSGTTYLQAVLRHNEERLRAQGVLVAGRTHVELVHAGMVVRDDNRLEQLPARAAQSWQRIVDQVHRFEGRVAIISYELLAGATREQAARAIADLAGPGADGPEVHVVISTRDLGRAVPSAWQERLKFALPTPLEEWRPRPVTAGPRAEWGWRTLEPSAVAARWGADLPPARVHVVTAPRGRSDPALLWRRFAEACTLDDVEVETGVPLKNESLGVRAAEVLRRVNTHDLGPISGAREHARWLRDVLAHQVLAPLDDEPMRLTDDQLADARERAGAAVARIREEGWQVHGDLDDLEATAREARLPSEVPAEELLDVATQAIVSLLVELRAERTAGGDAVSAPVAPHDGGSRLPDLLGRRAAARVDDLERRLAEAQREVQASRRLQERVAALTDLVGELLLPARQQDRKQLRTALRRYRKRSL